MSKQFAVVGNWDFQKREGKGLASYTYDPENAEMTHICTVRDDVSVGHQFVDHERGIIYVTYEERNLRGYWGGGGYVLAFRLDKETGELTQISDELSLAPLPSYIWLDKSKKYAIVTNHVTSNVVTKVVRNEDGTFSNRVETDDAAVILYRVKDDGSLGEVCDVYTFPSDDKVPSDPKNPRYAGGIPHMHSVVADPSGELYIICDKGVDKVYSFKIDRENGRLIHTDTAPCDERTAPRYSAFHPTLPVFYENNETSPYLITFGYDVETGKISEKSKMFIASEDKSKGMPSDLAVSADGRFLYTLVRGTDVISTFALGEDGMPSIIQCIPCGGEGPRGMRISPDGRFVFVANLNSGSVAIFSVNEDGTLTDTGKRTEAACPGNITII